METSFLIELFMCIIGPLIAAAGIPQIIRLYNRKKSGDVSLVTYTAYVFGQLCWLFYGVHLGSWPLILSCTLGLMINLAIFIFCLAYRQFDPEMQAIEIVSQMKEDVIESIKEEFGDNITEGEGTDEFLES